MELSNAVAAHPDLGTEVGCRTVAGPDVMVEPQASHSGILEDHPIEAIHIQHRRTLDQPRLRIGALKSAACHRRGPLDRRDRLGTPINFFPLAYHEHHPY